MVRSTVRLLLLLVVLVASGCQVPGMQRFDRHAMLATLTEGTILPQHQQFVAESEALAQAARAFRDAPSPDTLEALQDQWRQTALAWSVIEVYNLGPVKDEFIHNRINKWPSNPEKIEEHIAGATPLDEAFIESVGSNVKGLPAIEYLIFDPEADEAEILDRFTDGRRVDYLVASSENLQNTARTLYEQWAPEGEDYATDFVTADSDGSELQSSISMMTNEMVVLLENMANMKLATPIGRASFGTPFPTAAESWRSDSSLDRIGANLDALERAFNGGDGSEALGLDDYLAFRGVPSDGEPLAARIHAQIDATRQAVDAVGPSLTAAIEAEDESVTTLYEEARALLVLFKVDLANQLGITITFSDNDGD